MGQNESPSSAGRNLAMCGLGLAIGAAIATRQLVKSVDDNAGESILWLGLGSITLIFSSSLCLFFALARTIGQRQRSASISPAVAGHGGEYVAVYSLAIRVTAISIAGSFGTLTVFLAMRRASPGALAISGIFFVCGILYAVQVLRTRICFTRQGFVARLPWRREFQEPYERVLGISLRPWTLIVRFSNGRSLKVHSGLGNSDLVIAQLQARCPEALDLE